MKSTLNVLLYYFKLSYIILHYAKSDDLKDCWTDGGTDKVNYRGYPQLRFWQKTMDLHPPPHLRQGTCLSPSFFRQDPLIWTYNIPTDNPPLSNCLFVWYLKTWRKTHFRKWSHLSHINMSQENTTQDNLDQNVWLKRLLCSTLYEKSYRRTRGAKTRRCRYILTYS